MHICWICFIEWLIIFLIGPIKEILKHFKQVMTVVMKTALSHYYGWNELLSPLHFHNWIYTKNFALGCIYWFVQKMIALINIMSNGGIFKQSNKRNNQAFKRVMASVMKTIFENANSKSLWTKIEIDNQ